MATGMWPGAGNPGNGINGKPLFPNWTQNPNVRKPQGNNPQIQQQGVNNGNTLTMPTDWYEKMKSYIPQPKALTPFESTPEYAKLNKGFTDFSAMPEYQQAMNWTLPSKPTVNDQKYQTKWDLASQDINKSFNAPGGFFETAMGGLNERNLYTSGDRERVIGDLGDKMATALAQARAGIDVERMTEESDIDKMYAQMEAARNQAQSGAAMNLLGARSSQEQAQMNNLSNLLGLRTNRELSDRDTMMNYGTNLLNAGAQMSGIQNDMIYQNNQSDLQNQMLAAQKEQAMIDFLGQAFGSGGTQTGDILGAMQGMGLMPAGSYNQLHQYFPDMSYNTGTGSSSGGTTGTISAGAAGGRPTTTGPDGRQYVIENGRFVPIG